MDYYSPARQAKRDMRFAVVLFVISPLAAALAVLAYFPWEFQAAGVIFSSMAGCTLVQGFNFYFRSRENRGWSGR